MVTKRKQELENRMREYTTEDVVVAFSGGADSSLLLKLACKYAAESKRKVYAVTVQTKLHPPSDVLLAKKVASETGAIHKVLKIDELTEAGIEYNPPDRCYLCKRAIFEKIRELAKTLEVGTILEGTNADDLHQYRPGIRALRELEIISPLADCGVTKAEVRHLAAELGISVAERPASPCLATRLPYGTRIAYELLEKIDAGEKYLRSLGFYNVRVRVHGDTARIEVDAEDICRIVEQRKELIEHMKTLGFVYVTIDLEGFRSGSMDIKIENEM